MNNNFSKIALATIAWTSLISSSPGQPISPPVSPTGARNGQQLMEAAVGRSAAHATIRSKLRVSTRLMGQPLVGAGDYAQLRSSTGLLMRLDLSIQAGGKQTSVKQVCDGRDLWMHWQMGETQQLHHVDLKRVESALANGAGAALQADNPTSKLASGGIPKLLEQLAQNFDFGQAVPQSEELAKVPVWTAVGVWRLDKLAAIAPQAVQGGKIQQGMLPAHLPHQVLIQFGQSDLFPYKVVYQQREQNGEQVFVVPAVVIEFYEVAIGVELDPRQFDYHPRESDVVADRTDTYLKRLGVATRPAARKR